MENIVLYHIDYYMENKLRKNSKFRKGNIFKGSYKGMNFRIQKEGEGDEQILVAIAWKGPYILEKTEEKPERKEFPLTEEGLQEAEQWLTQMQPMISPGGE